jgi:hypothetical protein
MVAEGGLEAIAPSRTVQDREHGPVARLTTYWGVAADRSGPRRARFAGDYGSGSSTARSGCWRRTQAPSASRSRPTGRQRIKNAGDRKVLLLCCDHLPTAGREERVVWRQERLPRREVPGTRELPKPMPSRAHLNQPVVLAIGDQHRARQYGRVRSRSKVDRGRACRRPRTLRAAQGPPRAPMPRRPTALSERDPQSDQHHQDHDRAQPASHDSRPRRSSPALTH